MERVSVCVDVGPRPTTQRTRRRRAVDQHQVMLGHGTTLKPSPLSIMVKLPLASCAEPRGFHGTVGPLRRERLFVALRDHHAPSSTSMLSRFDARHVTIFF
jgi:hypothetical protein